MQTLGMIYARSRNYCIGKDGDLPWDLPDDYAFFETTTRGSAIIMGRRTYEDHDSAFPHRLNLVITSQPDYTSADGVITCRSLTDARIRSKEYANVFVIGGVALFTAAFADVQQVYETVVHKDIDGDTFLPPFDYSDFDTKVILEHDADERHAAPFTVFHHTR